ncbi:MAG: hypothetical protein K0U78_20930 [Actinomycetia bacterium]|nr:hypothetical protein [Actinomycetes bacterium]
MGASGLSRVVLGLGDWAFGPLTMLVVAAGFAGGLLAWLVLPSRGSKAKHQGAVLDGAVAVCVAPRRGKQPDGILQLFVGG